SISWKSRTGLGGRLRVTYLPISHTEPRAGENAKLIPPGVAHHLGLTAENPTSTRAMLVKMTGRSTSLTCPAAPKDFTTALFRRGCSKEWRTSSDDIWRAGAI